MKAIAADAQVSSEQLAAELLELWHHLTRGASQQLYGLIADLDISITQMKTLHALDECADEVSVKVLAYTDKGKRRPAPGATVDFASGPTDAAGRTNLVFPSAGRTSVQATRGGDIPSAKLRVCVDADISRCPSHRGRIILGSPRSDDISTTAGNDTVRAGARDDRISIRAGGADSVGCGPGKDVVVASRGDHDDAIGSSCEKVIRK